MSRPYNLTWAVEDTRSNNDYSHTESSDGQVVTGSYRVPLPDGRIQTVPSKAEQNGYFADVKYEGVAKFPPPPSTTTTQNTTTFLALK